MEKVELIKVQNDFKKFFNQFCLEHNLDTFQAIRILSKTIEETAHQARNISLFSIVDCKECGGSGFSGRGSGYDSVCDNCGGRGEMPEN